MTDVTLEDKYIIRRIQNHLSRGINSAEGEVTDARQTLFNSYMGAEYGNERDGSSRIVTRQVFEAVEWALGPLLRVFLGGVRAVEFRPSGPDDVQQAKLETSIVNHWFFDGNPDETGFIVLYNFIKDLLMFQNAYLYIEPMEEFNSDKEYFQAVTEEQLDEYYAIEGATVDIEKKYKSPMGVPVSDICVTQEKAERRIAVSVLPPECCIVDHDHHKLGLDSARFVGIREPVTKSDLRKLGYDNDLIDDLGNGEQDSALWNDEEVTRLFYADEEPQGEGSTEDNLELDADKVLVRHTCFMDIDMNEDGVNERYCVIMAGTDIIETEPYTVLPIVAGSAMPVPHKHIGMGLAEVVEDIQRIFTSLTRQLLDNIQAQNVARTYISEQALLSDSATIDAMLDRESEVIIVRGDPHAAVMQETVTPIVAEIVQAIQALEQTPQLRTGVAPNVSLDPSVLEKSTMGAFVGALEQASQRLELTARIIAETVLVPAFQKMHLLGRENFTEDQQVEIEGQWVTANPSKWKKRSKMNVNVGIGFNNKQMMLMLLQQLLQMQKEALPMNMTTFDKIYNTLEKLIEQANLGHASTYFSDPKAQGWKPPQPQPDPAMIQAQANAQSLAAEAKRKDAELAFNQEKAKEEAEGNAAKLTNELFKVRATTDLNTAQIAKIHAEITHLNRDKNAQVGPAGDSSADEFAAASGGSNGSAATNDRSRGKPASAASSAS